MPKPIEIDAQIKEVKYSPLVCNKLKVFGFKDLNYVLSRGATVILRISKSNQIALSSWVSAKRTRSYPFARVYDSLSFSGKKVTVIPVFKDEGAKGDRDFLQWDTISLMSLLGVYVIIAYYKDAIKNPRYENKITNQRFDVDDVSSEIKKLGFYQSDALHWNLKQIDKVPEISKKALESYEKIGQKLKVKMSSKKSAEKRIEKLLEGREKFMEFSRILAKKAQKRESLTTQPKEKVDGSKAMINIKNYLGGNYYLTADEIKIVGKKIFLVEAKHSQNQGLPSSLDIKDGLIKMILFTNLEEVIINNRKFTSVPVLKLTTEENISELPEQQKKFLNLLKKESRKNKFLLKIN